MGKPKASGTLSDLDFNYVEEVYGVDTTPVADTSSGGEREAVSTMFIDGERRLSTRLISRQRSVSYDSFMLKKKMKEIQRTEESQQHMESVRERTQSFFANLFDFKEADDYETQRPMNAKEAQERYNEEAFERELEGEAGKSLGTKSIGTFSSFVFVFNQISGPGSLAIPIVLQQSGMVPTLVIMLFFVLISALCSTFLIEATGKIPGNEDFHKRIEYGSLVRYYFGGKVHFVFQIFLNLTLQALNISAIVITCQSLDTLFTFVYGTVAVQMYPHFEFLKITHMRDVNDILYAGSGTKIMITLGYVATAIISIPLGFLNLDDNMKVQWISFIFLLIFFFEFLWDFGFNHRAKYEELKLFRNNFSQLSSVFIMSFAFPMLIPSWINEKKPHVSVNRTIFLSGVFTFIGYVLFGFMGLIAYYPLHSDDFLITMTSARPMMLTKLCIYFFSLFIIFPGIPVCCITTRYNLYVGRICRKWPAFFFGIVAPWLVGFLFLQGEFFSMLLNWSSLVLISLVNFVFPFIIFLKCRFEFENRFSDTRHFMSNLQKTVLSHYFHAVPQYFDWRRFIVYFFVFVLFFFTVFIVVFGISYNVYALAVLKEDLLG